MRLFEILNWTDVEVSVITEECYDAARKVDRAKIYLRWCIESGESECGLRVARENLIIADEEFDHAISIATIEQRESFIISSQVDSGPV